MRHVILGAGGAIGDLATDCLLSQGAEVVRVSRRAQPYAGPNASAGASAGVAGGKVIALRGDLTVASDVDAAVGAGDTVYLCAGLPYRSATWQAQWPVVMENAIAACVKSKARLVFFDNVYMYGKVDGRMTESTPHNPCSRKGEVRARIAERLESLIRKGEVQGLIARSADFYGPKCEKTSAVNMLVVDRLKKGQQPIWFLRLDRLHSFTHTGDAAHGLCLLAQKDAAYGQVWHLPTAPAVKVADFIAMAAIALKIQKSPKPMVLQDWLMRVMGLFAPDIRESREMMYQNAYDYVFDSSKMERAFSIKPLSYADGLKAMV